MLNSANLFVLLSVLCVSVIAAPYQELPLKPGYVPVYIREGDTPLSEIHPKLVEAFHEDEKSFISVKEPEAPKEVQVGKNDGKARADIENYSNKDQGKSELKVENLEDAPASDIAEFTNDDLKTFDHKIPDKETK